MIEIITSLLAFIISFILTGEIRKYALSRDILDTPNERSSHTTPTPRGGGLAFVITFYLFLLIFFGLGYIETSILYALMGLAVIALIGVIDDHGHIPARYRLLIHFVAAGWCVYWSGIMTSDVAMSNPYVLWVITLFSLFYLVWLLNLFNFMDGIDGIASVETITVLGCAACLILMQSDHTPMDSGLFLLFIVVMAAVAGFLLWNWPPAKIFMGDVGSAFVGILIAVLSLITAKLGIINFTAWLILLAVFITDASLTLMVRIILKEKVHQAHRSHAYQYFARQYGHKKVTLAVLIINMLWLFPLAILTQSYASFSGAFMLLAYLPLLIIAVKGKAGLPG